MDEFDSHRTSRDYPRYRVLATAGAIAVSIVGTVSCAVAVAQPGGHGATRPSSPAADGDRAAMAAAPPAWRRSAPDRADRSARARLGGPAALPRLERRLAESARADAEQG